MGESDTNSGAPLLDVRDLHVSVGETEILKGIDLTVNLGEVHAIMGPNGSGKSTLAHVLAGRDGYRVTAGEVLYRGEDLLGLALGARQQRREGRHALVQRGVARAARRSGCCAT